LRNSGKLAPTDMMKFVLQGTIAGGYVNSFFFGLFNTEQAPEKGNHSPVAWRRAMCLIARLQSTPL